METNLIERDIDIFIKKYTRFLSKNIYITNSLHTNFLNNYNYLIKELEKNIFLYKNTNRYQKITKLIQNQTDLLKHHNTLFLKSLLSKYNQYFDNIYPKEKLNINARKIILSEEEQLLLIENKNIVPLICSKIKYLIDNKNIREEHILILTSNKPETQIIKKELKEKFNYTNISIYTKEEYVISIKPTKKIINNQMQNYILSNYLKNIFKDKEKFTKLYTAFKNKIYLNKDYKDYDTFKDYHNYLFKRMYLESNMSLKKYNEKEINQRRKYLRTINNEIVTTKEEVDIANFLYLNNIPYKYNQDKSQFFINNSNSYKYIKYLSTSPAKIDKDYIYIYPNNKSKLSHLETLTYELIKNRYPLDRISNEEVYNRLKDTTENNYFTNFINNYLIPIITTYKTNHTITINLTENQKKELKKIYDYYQEYLNQNNFLDKSDILNIIQDNLTTKKKYKQLITTIPNLKLNFTNKLNSLTIIFNYQDDSLIFKDNIKLFYNYKTYLAKNSIIPIPNTYINTEELTNLTNKYIKENIKIIENYLAEKTTKGIEIYLYNDNNRLLISKEKSRITNQIISNIKNKDKLLLLGKTPNDINTILTDNYFSKKNKTTIIYNLQNIQLSYKDISHKIDKIYNNIILINLIPNQYEDELPETTTNYQLKLLLYIALTKSKDKIYILYPKSKSKIITNLNLKNTYIYE